MSAAEGAALTPATSLDIEWERLDRQDIWEDAVRARGQISFTELLNYAAGLTASAMQSGAVPDDDGIIIVPITVVWVIALACYEVAYAAGLDDVGMTSVPDTIGVLVFDGSARAATLTRPGHTQALGGRLHAQDRAKLRTAARPGGHWRAWCDSAIDVLFHHLRWAPATDRGPVLLDLATEVRDAGVRRDWYDHSGPALLVPGEAGERW